MYSRSEVGENSQSCQSVSWAPRLLQHQLLLAFACESSFGSDVPFMPFTRPGELSWRVMLPTIGDSFKYQGIASKATKRGFQREKKIDRKSRNSQ